MTCNTALSVSAWICAPKRLPASTRVLPRNPLRVAFGRKHHTKHSQWRHEASWGTGRWQGARTCFEWCHWYLEGIKEFVWIYLWVKEGLHLIFLAYFFCSFPYHFISEPGKSWLSGNIAFWRENGWCSFHLRLNWQPIMNLQGNCTQVVSEVELLNLGESPWSLSTLIVS